MTRIGTLGHQEALLVYVRELQSRLAESQIQIASGKKSQTLSGMATDAPRLLTFEDASAKYQRLIANIEVAEHRAALTDLNVERMESIAREMRGLLRSQPTSYTELAQIARNYLREFADVLNQVDGSRALFAGSNTAGPAVTIYEPGTADPAAPFFGVDNVLPDSYRYKVFATGVPADTAIKVSDTLTMTTQLNFASPAVNAMTRTLDALIRIADFGTAANPAPTPANVATAEQELTDALQGVAGVVIGYESLRMQLALDRNMLAGVKESHANFLKYAADTLGKLTDIDTAAVATQLNSQQINLEASYAALARITSVSLLDFLK